MAEWQWWEINNYDCNTTSLPGYNFFSYSSSSDGWKTSKNEAVVPVSPKVRDRQNLEKVRKESLRREYRVRR